MRPPCHRFPVIRIDPYVTVRCVHVVQTDGNCQFFVLGCVVSGIYIYTSIIYSVWYFIIGPNVGYPISGVHRIIEIAITDVLVAHSRAREPVYAHAQNKVYLGTPIIGLNTNYFIKKLNKNHYALAWFDKIIRIRVPVLAVYRAFRYSLSRSEPTVFGGLIAKLCLPSKPAGFFFSLLFLFMDNLHEFNNKHSMIFLTMSAYESMSTVKRSMSPEW